MTKLYSKRSIRLFYMNKEKELLKLARIIKSSNLSGVYMNHYIHTYKGSRLYLFEFMFENNERFHIHNRIFSFHIKLNDELLNEFGERKEFKK